jgi:hypothetical protein
MQHSSRHRSQQYSPQTTPLVSSDDRGTGKELLFDLSSRSAKPVRVIMKRGAFFGQRRFKQFWVDWRQSIKFVDVYENELGAEPSRHQCRDVGCLSGSAGEIRSANNWPLIILLFHRSYFIAMQAPSCRHAILVAPLQGLIAKTSVVLLEDRR